MTLRIHRVGPEAADVKAGRALFDEGRVAGRGRGGPGAASLERGVSLSIFCDFGKDAATSLSKAVVVGMAAVPGPLPKPPPYSAPNSQRSLPWTRS